MRLDRLDLSAYGRWDGRSLTFAPGARLHVVYGPNESGKSTTLSAVLDLLYGFKAKDHPYTFRHPQPLLGGRVSRDDGAALDFVRRRAGRGAEGLLTPDQKSALPDDALAPFLSGVGKDEFERLHALDWKRLESGGREMMNPDGDVGRKLFAAGAGLEELHRLERAFAAAVDRIGEQVGQRGQKTQILKATAQDYDKADRDLKAAGLKTADLARARTRLEEAANRAAVARRAVETLKEEEARLARVQRVRPLLAELDRLRGGLPPGAATPDLPDALTERWAAALRDAELADAAALRAVRAVEDAAEDLAAAPSAGPFAALESDVAALTAQLGKYQKAGEDLPRCEAERRVKLETAADALRRLGVAAAPEDAENHAPRAGDRSAARDLAGRRRDAAQAAAAAVKAADKARRDLADADAALAALGPVVDGARAAVPAEQATALADAPARLEAARAAAAAAERDVAAATTALTALGRWSGNRAEGGRAEGGRGGGGGDWAEPAIPAAPDAATIKAFEDAAADLRARETAASRRRNELEEEMIAADAAVAAAQAVGVPPTRREIDDARLRRDEGLALLVAALRGAADPAAVDAWTGGGDLAAAAAAAVRDADRLADRRTEEAQRAQAYETALERRLAVVARLERAAREAQAQADERTRLIDDWRAAWGPVKAGSAADMRDWLAARRAALDAARKLDDASAALVPAEARCKRWAALWRAAAGALGLTDDDGNDDPAVLAALTQRRLNALAAENRQREALTRNRQRAADALAAATRDMEDSAAQEAALAERWRDLSPRLGQAPDFADGALETVLDLWEAVEAASRERRDLERRIAGMGRDRAAFEEAAEALRRTLAERGVPLPADAAAAPAVLHAGLAEDQRRIAVQAEKRRSLEKRREEAAAAERVRREAHAATAALRAAHGLSPDDDVPKLCAAAATSRRLTSAGDGRDEATLRDEAARIDADAAGARLATLAAEQIQAQAALDAALTERADAAAAWDRLQREAGAEAAARRRADAARRAGAAAAELLQIKAAQFLLRRAVERFREANQDPLLSRASAMFAAVVGSGAATGAADDPIVGLESRIGDDGRPVLSAVRRGGATVGVDGLSEGTAHQLFLALRLAALERRAAQGRPLPFIVDDVFQTSDDARTAAALGLLAELGRSCQVIVFTHHRAVVDAARRVVASPAFVDVVDLAAL